MENNGCFAELSWNDEDIENALDCCNREVTAENVKKVRKILVNKDAMRDWLTMQGFEFMYDVIYQNIKDDE